MAELDRAAISQRLKQSREAAGLTQKEMADLLHVHKRTVEDYESLKKPTIPFDRLDEWGRATGTNRDWILHDGALPAAVVEDDATPPGVLLERLAVLEAALEELRAALDVQSATLERIATAVAPARRVPASGHTASTG